MLRTILVICILALLLTACGDNTMPTTATTSATDTKITTTTATATMTQNNNRSVCVGLFNLGSCNTTQVTVQTQTVHGKVAGSPAPTQSGMSGIQVVTTLVLLCVGFMFVVGIAGAVMSSGGYN